MAFFRNRTVNLLNLHTAISMIALTGGGAFFWVYLLKAGISVPGVFLSLTAVFLLRLVLRSFLIFVAVRSGLRRLVVLGAIALALQFPVAAFVHGVGWTLLWLVIACAVGDTIYWPSYHAYYASLGDEEHRGHQLGLREAASALVGIASPVIVGWLLVVFGPVTAFVATAAIQAASAIPLLWTPDIPIARSAPGALRASLPGVALFVCDGWIAASYVIAWQITLFLTLGENFLAYGGALAVAALVGAAGGLLLGRYIDAGNGSRAAWYAIGTLCFVIVLRAGVQNHPALAVVANALGALAGCLYIPTLMTVVYNQAKSSPCTLRFHIATEGGWDLGFMACSLFSALLVSLGFSLSLAILSGVLGAAAMFVLLQRYYAAHALETVEAARGGLELQIKPGDMPNV